MWWLTAPHGESLGTNGIVPDVVKGDTVFALLEAVDAVDQRDGGEHGCCSISLGFDVPRVCLVAPSVAQVMRSLRPLVFLVRVRLSTAGGLVGEVLDTQTSRQVAKRIEGYCRQCFL